MSLQFRKGTNAERLTITPLTGEPIWTTDTRALFVGDGVTPGGIIVSNTGTAYNFTITNELYISNVGGLKKTAFSGVDSVNLVGITQAVVSAPTIRLQGNDIYLQGTTHINGIELERLTSPTGQLIVEGGLAIQDAGLSNTATNFSITGPLSANTGTFNQVISGGVVNKGYAVTTSPGAVAMSIAEFDSAEFGSAKYIVQINRPDGGYRETVELLIMTDDTDVYVNEYGKIANQTLAGNFIVSITAGIVSIEYHWTITPDPTGPLKAKVSATLIPE